jgi:hypothetical protein
VALVAVARRLLRIANAVIRDGRAWGPEQGGGRLTPNTVAGSAYLLRQVHSPDSNAYRNACSITIANPQSRFGQVSPALFRTIRTLRRAAP